MHPRTIAKLTSVVLLALAFTCVWEWEASRRHAGGKEAFLTAQSQRFDKFYANPRAMPIGSLLRAAVFASGSSIAAYEVLAFGIYKIIRLMRPSEDTDDKQT